MDYLSEQTIRNGTRLLVLFSGLPYFLSKRLLLYSWL